MKRRMGTLVHSAAEPMLIITTYAAFQTSPCDVMLMVLQTSYKTSYYIFFS